MRYFILVTMVAVFALLGVSINTSTKQKNILGVQALDLQEMTAADYSANRLLCPHGSNCCTVFVASDYSNAVDGRKALNYYLRQRTSASPLLYLNT